MLLGRGPALGLGVQLLCGEELDLLCSAPHYCLPASAGLLQRGCVGPAELGAAPCPAVCVILCLWAAAGCCRHADPVSRVWEEEHESWAVCVQPAAA